MKIYWLFLLCAVMFHSGCVPAEKAEVAGEVSSEVLGEDETSEAVADEPDESATRHCFVMCAGAEPGDLSKASEIARRILGDEYSAEVNDGNIISVTHGEKAVGFLLHNPDPIPDGEAEFYADRNFLWADGREEVAGHRSHVVVTNIGRDGGDAIESAMTVSRLALVALELFDGIGVYWGNGKVCNSRKMFESFCGEMSVDELPVPVWLRFQLVNAPDDRNGMYTLGMSQFGLMDIEVESSELNVAELFSFISSTADYLIHSGPVIADGNTVGGSPDDRIVVRHRPSMIDEDKLVYKIIFEK